MKSLLLISFFMVQFALFAQDDALIEYFMDHAKPMNEDEINFDLLDTRNLDQYSFFASSEAHGVYLNQVYKLELFKYLYQNAGVRTIVMEAGYSDAFLLNKYLESGDENLLSKRYQVVELAFWRGLKSFNDHEKNKVKVIGIDFERSEAIGKVFNLIFGPDIPSEIKQNIEALKTVHQGIDIKDRKRVISHTKKMLDNYPDSYQNYLGADYDLFVSVIKNEVPVTPSVKRDKKAIRNFLSYHNSNPEDRYFSQYGISHVNRNFGNLVGMLNNHSSSPLKNKTLVLIPQYFDCIAILPDRVDKVDGYGILQQEGVSSDRIKTLFDEPFVLMDLSELSDDYESLKRASDYVMLVKGQLDQAE